MGSLAPTFRARVRGCLLGLAVGDALAAPVAGLKAGRVRQLFGEVADHIDAREAWIDRPHRWHLPGLHTDETQQALAVIAAFIESESHGALAGSDALTRAVANLWQRMAFEPRDERLALGVHRGFGPTFRRALLAMRSGEGPTGHPSAGSGAAARLAPLGLLLRDRPEDLTRAVIALALLTHRDPRAIAGALAVAHALALLTTAEDSLRLNAAAFVEELTARVRGGEKRMLIDHLGSLHLDREAGDADPLHAVSRAVSAVAGLVMEGDDDLAVRTLIRQANHLGPRQPVTTCNAGFAPVTVPVALYFALKHARFAAPVSRLVSEGKEADTAGAILGALLGARLGEETIPSEWRTGLLGREEVAVFAEAILDQPTENLGDFLVRRELEWTLKENAAREPLLAALARRRARDEKRVAAHPRRPKPPVPPEPMPFAPPPQTYLTREDDPGAKQRLRAARGRKRIDWKEDRRKGRRR
jgi:ADP-ribosyl-[dinitrogen reductase] hydrolase